MTPTIVTTMSASTLPVPSAWCNHRLPVIRQQGMM
jgi:hypothetical protein